MANKVVYISVF